VSRIEAPRIPDRVYRVADFGGVPDGVQDARPAIAAAIARASAEGGGRVVLSPGVWLSRGPIHLESRIELHLARGAHLLFSPDPADYLPVVETRWEGTRVLSYSPLIYARDVEDVAVTGPGTVDGNAGSRFHAWHGQAQPDLQRLRRTWASPAYPWKSASSERAPTCGRPWCSSCAPGACCYRATRP
jgi:polygalacturonase